MGKKDLPGHWERCILLSEEELIWLFSDDDLMPFDGVARVIQASQKYSDEKRIFRFPLEVVDEYGKLKYKNPPFKTDLTSGYEFLLDKLSGKLVLPPVSMYLAEQYGNKREDLLSSLWPGAPMMRHGLNLQNLQEGSYLYQAIPSVGEMPKERIYQTPLISIKKRLEQQYFS